MCDISAGLLRPFNLTWFIINLIYHHAHSLIILKWYWIHTFIKDIYFNFLQLFGKYSISILFDFSRKFNIHTYQSLINRYPPLPKYKGLRNFNSLLFLLLQRYILLLTYVLILSLKNPPTCSITVLYSQVFFICICILAISLFFITSCI